MRNIALLLLLASLGSAIGQGLNATCFSNSGALLQTPSDPGFQGDAATYNQKVHNTPAAVAYAYSTEQVQSIVQCATNSGLKVHPRGGGHGYEGKL